MNANGMKTIRMAFAVTCCFVADTLVVSYFQINNIGQVFQLKVQSSCKIPKRKIRMNRGKGRTDRNIVNRIDIEYCILLTL